MAKQAYKRKEFYTDSQMQFKYISIIIALVTVESCIFGGSIYYIFMRAKSMPTEHTLIFIYLCTLALLIGMAVVNTYIGIHATHKIAGPLYKFSKIANLISEGNISTLVNLRDNDLLQEFESDFNDMINALRQFVKQDSQKKESILSEAKILKEKLGKLSLPQADKEAFNGAIDSIIENSSKIGKNFIMEENNEKNSQ